MKRRSFLSALASVPFLGRFVPKDTQQDFETELIRRFQENSRRLEGGGYLIVPEDLSVETIVTPIRWKDGPLTWHVQ